MKKSIRRLRINDTVSFRAYDGKTYGGTIKGINNGIARVVYVVWNTGLVSAYVPLKERRLQKL